MNQVNIKMRRNTETFKNIANKLDLMGLYQTLCLTISKYTLWGFFCENIVIIFQNQSYTYLQATSMKTKVFYNFFITTMQLENYNTEKTKK